MNNTCIFNYVRNIFQYYYLGNFPEHFYSLDFSAQMLFLFTVDLRRYTDKFRIYVHRVCLNHRGTKTHLTIFVLPIAVFFTAVRIRTPIKHANVVGR